MKKYSQIWRFVVGSLFAMTLTACGQEHTSAMEHVENAKAYIEKDALKNALIELQSAAQADPMLPEARWLLATTALALGDGHLAEKEVDRAIALGLEPASAQVVKIRSLLMQGDVDRVLSESRTILENNTPTGRAVILANRGMAFMQKEQFDLAKKAFNKALEEYDNSLDVFIGLARYYLATNQYTKARDWAMRAVNADSNSPDAWSALGSLEFSEGNLESAEKAFSKAISKRHFATLDRAKRALINVQLGNFAQADKEIQELRSGRMQGHPYINYVAGRNFIEQEQIEKAIPEFEAVFAVKPNVETAMYLAVIHHLSGNDEQARTYTERVLSALPRSVGARRLMGRLDARHADFKKAKSLLTSTLEGKQEDTATLYLLATLSLQTGDVADALEYASLLKEYHPDSSVFNGILQVTQLMSGEQVDAMNSIAEENKTSDKEVMESEIIRVMAALRDKEYKQALQLSLELRDKYPQSAIPLNLVSASYVAMGNGRQAKEAMEKALEIEPHNPNAAMNLAKIELQLGNIERAKVLLHELVDARPENVGAAVELARLNLKTGAEEKALEVLNRSLTQNPKDFTLLSELTVVLFKTQKYSDLVRTTDKLDLQSFTQHPILLEYRARAQFLLEDVVSARRSFEMLVDILPNSAKAYYYLGDVIAASGDRYNALEKMRKASELDADYFPARLSIARLLSETNQLALAREETDNLREIFGERAEILGLSGWLRLQNADYSAAEKELAKAQSERPDTALTLYLSKALWEQKKYQEGLNVMLAWIEKYPRDVAVLFNLGNAYLNIGMEDDAKKVYEAILQIIPENLVALNNLAWLLKDKPEGVEYAERAYALAPNDPNVLDTLGTIALQRGDTARSLNLLGRAAERAPNDLSIQLNWGRALLEGHKLVEAAKIFKVVAASDSLLAEDARGLLQSMPAQENIDE